MKTLILEHFLTGRVFTLSTERLICAILGADIYKFISDDDANKLIGRSINGNILKGIVNSVTPGDGINPVQHLPAPLKEWRTNNGLLNIMDILTGEVVEYPVANATNSLIDNLINGEGILYFGDPSKGRPEVTPDLARQFEDVPVYISHYTHKDKPHIENYRNYKIAAKVLQTRGFGRPGLIGELLLSLATDGKYRYKDVRCSLSPIKERSNHYYKYLLTDYPYPYVVNRYTYITYLTGIADFTESELESILSSETGIEINNRAIAHTRILDKDSEMTLPEGNLILPFNT